MNPKVMMRGRFLVLSSLVLLNLGGLPGCAATGAGGDIPRDDGDVPAASADTPTGDATEDPDAWMAHYDPARVLRYDLTIDPGDLAAMMSDPQCASGQTPCGSEYVHGTMRFEGREVADVGIRFKGNSSMDSVVRIPDGQPGAGRYSFKVKTNKFQKGLRLDGIDTFNFHNGFLDPSLLREHLAYRAFRDAGAAASRTAFVDLWVNGERWGFYVSVQEVDKAFLQQNFGDDAGNLYKPEPGPLVYRGPSIADYAMTIQGGGGEVLGQPSGDEAYAKQTNEKEADFTDIIGLMDALTNAPDEGFEAALRTVLDVDRLLDALAVNAVIVALDGYGGGQSQNYYLYRVPASGRFVFIPWDMNNAFGTFDCFTLNAEQVMHLNPREPYCLGTPDATGGGEPIEAADRPLVSRVLAAPALRDAYEARIRELLAGPLAPEAMAREMDEVHARIASFVAQDPRPFYTPDEFVRSLDETVDHAPGLKPFVRDRAAILLAMLDAPVACGDGTCGTGENCPAECRSKCPSCQVWFVPKSMCVPSCTGGCQCPSAGPDGQALVCDQAAGICHP